MPRRWKVLTLVSVGVFMVSLDLFIVNIAFPKIEGDFAGSSVSSISWVLNAYAIVLAAFMVSAGRLADRHGRRRAFLWGLAIFVLGSALCGLAPSVGALVGARVVQAVGAAFLLPTSLALLLPEFEPEDRPQAIGIWAAIGGLAAAAGPPIGGLLVELSWRLVFLVNVPIGIVAIAYGSAPAAREPRREAAAPGHARLGAHHRRRRRARTRSRRGARLGLEPIPARSPRSPSQRPGWRPSGRAA